MKRARIAGHNLTIGPPKGWNPDVQGYCETIHVRVEVIDGIQFMRTAWEPEPHDLARLNAGGMFEIGVSGSIHPMMNLRVGDPPTEQDVPGVFSPSFTLIDHLDPDGSLWLGCIARYGLQELKGRVCRRDKEADPLMPRAVAASRVIDEIEARARAQGLETV